MTAKVSVAGTIVRIDNRYLAARAWRLDVCCLPADADHDGGPDWATPRRTHAQRGDGEAPHESAMRRDSFLLEGARLVARSLISSVGTHNS
jgi:hypothetical protein